MSAAPQVKDLLKFAVEVVSGPHQGLKMDFNKASVSIGRGPENDIVLANDPRASRNHAEIRQRGGTEFVIVNVSAKNFVVVNGKNIQSEAISNESVIHIGDTEIRVHIEMPVVEKKPVASVPQAAVGGGVTLKPLPSPSPLPQRPRPVSSVKPPVMPNPQAYQYGGYQSPPPPSPGRAPSGGLLQNPKARFYGVVALVGLLGWFLLSPTTPNGAKDPNAFRTSAISMQDVADAEKRSQELMTVKKEKYDSIQYRRAQENFIKGFRDFQQGQYARAREAFQVVLNLDPDNELAKRYYHLSKIKFDELVKFNMIQGNRYREKRNWRMCQSNYSNVMTMLQYRKDDPTYKEAKQFYEECTLNLEGGRY